MTLTLKRCTASLRGIAVCILIGAFLAPLAVEAQSPSASMRTAPPTKMHAAKSAMHAATPWVANPAVGTKDSYLIVDAMSGRELASDRPDELRHPASLTKLMTLYLTFSALDSGRLSLGDALPISLAALNAPPTKMGMMGGTVTVRDAVMGLVTRSANDAAIALAEALGGSEEDFARAMTQKARQLGMTSTVFRNASGLPNREQVTTARDMSKLAHALLRDFPHYYPAFAVQSYFFHGRTLENHNRMLTTYPGADGLKTGYTVASGFNLVMSAIRGNHRLIGVVMGGDTAFQRDRLMAELMDRGFETAQSLLLSPWSPPRVPPSARYGAANFVPGSAIPETVRLGAVVKAEPAAPPPVSSVSPVRVASAPASESAEPALGSWVIQVGSFNDTGAAELALTRATAALPADILSHGAASIDDVQLVQKTLHRARLTNLSQDEAIAGCKHLTLHKIYCAAIQVTAWNTPGAR
jgi:D-alanyl-D-alanine carboxypeptidase